MKQQRGATLLVALVVLLLMTMTAVMSFNISRTNTLIVGNQQARQQVNDTARAALDEVMSKTHFATSPSAPFGTSNSKSYDVDGNGSSDVTVVMTPAPCIKNYTILPVDPDDTTSQGCVGGQLQTMGVEGAATSGTLCADVIWELSAVATDSVTEASATAVQGVRIRQDANATINTANYCP